VLWFAAQLFEKAPYLAFFRAALLAGDTDFFPAPLFAGFDRMVALARVAVFFTDRCVRVFRATGAAL
jgi:hypothetical protein